MVTIEIFTSPHYPVDRKIIRRAIEESMKKIGLKSFTQVTISIVGDRKVRDLNRKFRGQDKTTNVLSFPLHESSADLETEQLLGRTLNLGDIIISYPVARLEAAAENILVDQRLGQLSIHGMLHLVGFDHENEFEARQMEKLEDEIYLQAGL